MQPKAGEQVKMISENLDKIIEATSKSEIFAHLIKAVRRIHENSLYILSSCIWHPYCFVIENVEENIYIIRGFWFSCRSMRHANVSLVLN